MANSNPNRLQRRMNLAFVATLVRARHVASGKTAKSLRALVGASLAFALVGGGQALAQATSPTGGIGAQANTMSSEALNAGSTGFEMVAYILAVVAFVGGGWALWQSRQPQNRESGHVGRGIAGLVLCGLFATAGVWIGKASVSASGGNATITTTPGMVSFGSGTTSG